MIATVPLHYSEVIKSCMLYLAQLQIDVAEYPYYRIVQEGDGNIQVCLQTNRIVTEPLHVFVETTYMNTTGNAPAIGNDIKRVVLLHIQCINKFYTYR